MLAETAPPREPGTLFDDVMSATVSVRQRPRLLAGQGTGGVPVGSWSTSRAAAALAMGLLLLALIGVGLLGGGAPVAPLVLPSASPTSTPGATVAASPTESAVPILPGESWILYERFVQLGGGLYAMRFDGSDDHAVLTGIPGTHHQSDWSPDGNQVVFMDATTDSMWMAGIDGSNPVRVGACERGGCGNPAWSPDGKRIAFSRAEGATGVIGPAAVGVYIVDIASGSVSTVVRLQRPLLADVPRWSRDGSQLVIGVDRMDDQANETGAAIAVVPATGGEPRYLTDFALFGYAPDWSPTGDSIVFSPQVRDFQPGAAEQPATWNLFIVHADGTGLRQITTVTPGDRLWGPDWTRDGSHIIVGDQARQVAVLVDPSTGAFQSIGGSSLAFGRDRPVP